MTLPRFASRVRLAFAVLTLAFIATVSLCTQSAVAGTPDPDVSGWPIESRDAFHSGTTTNTLGPRITPGAVWSSPAKAYGGPVVGDGKIFYWGANDALVSASTTNGTIAWASDPTDLPSLGYRGFALDNGYFYAADYNYVRMYRASDGQKLAQVYPGSGWYSPTVKSGVYYSTGINQCNVLAFNSTTLGLLWYNQVPDECTSSPGVAVKDGKSYIGNGAGYLSAFSASGSGIYATRLRDYAYVSGSPLIDSEDDVVVGVWDGISAGDPSHHWVTQQLARGVRYSEKGDVVAVNRQSGEIRWSYTTDARLDAAPVEYNGTIIAIDRSGATYGLDAQTGALRWKWSPPNWVAPAAPQSVWAVQTLVVSGENVFVPHLDGSVYTLKASTGELVSSLAVPGTPRFLAADGETDQLYVWYESPLQDPSIPGPQGILAAFHTSEANEAPIARAGSDRIVDEGDQVQLDGTTSTDPDGDLLTFSWKRTSSVGPAAQLSATDVASPNFPALDDGENNFALTVKDDKSASSTASVSVRTRNVAPTVTASDSTAQADGATALSATFSDPGVLDTHSATVDWGDGTPVEPTAVTQGSGWGSVVAAHRYAQPGSYAAKVTVTDDDGGTSTGTTGGAIMTVKRTDAAIWANSTSAFLPPFIWLGVDNSAKGLVHSNADLKIAGVDNSFTGGLEYARFLWQLGWRTTINPSPVKTAAAAPPVQFDVVDYKPGGTAAKRAGQNYYDKSSSCFLGAWTIADVNKRFAPGVYYAPCTIIVAGANLSGNVTFVSKENVLVKGVNVNFQAYQDGLLFAAGSGAGDAVLFAGAHSNLSGISYTRNGQVSITGHDLKLTCSLVSDRLSVTGSHITVAGGDCSSGQSKATALSTIAPSPQLSLTTDRQSALPGDSLAYTAKLANPGATLVVSGLMGAQNSGDQTATGAHYAYQLQYQSATDGKWKTLAATDASSSGYAPIETPPTKTGISLVTTPAAWPGASYPAGSEHVLGTTIASGAQAAWAYQARIPLTAAQVQLLHDPTKSSGIRSAVHIEFSPSGSTVREFYRTGDNFIAKFRSQSPDLTNASLQLSPPSGQPLNFASSNASQLARIAPGQSATVTGSYSVPVIEARGATESSDSYLARLRSRNNRSLRATARADVSSDVGRLYVPRETTSSTESIPLVALALGSPATAQAGQSANFTIGLSNTGLRRAVSIATSTSLDGQALPSVPDVPTELAAGGTETTEGSVALPGSSYGALAHIGQVTWNDENGNHYGPVSSEKTIDVLPPALVTAKKTASLATDSDGNGIPTPGDTLEYKITVRNASAGGATGVVLTDQLDSGTSAVASTLTTDVGAPSAQGNDSGHVSVDVGSLAGGQTATISFRAAVQGILPASKLRVSNQATVMGDGMQPVLSDDPSLPGASDPTVTLVDPDGPKLRHTLRDSFVDNDSSGSVTPGDLVRFTAKVTNTGRSSATGSRFKFFPGAYTILQPLDVSTSFGTIRNGHRLQDSSIDIDPRTIAPNQTLTVRFAVRVTTAIPGDVDYLSNQAQLTTNERGLQVSDDPDTPAADDATRTKVRDFASIGLTKAATLSTDSDGSGGITAGDILQYVIVASNSTTSPVDGIVVDDSLGANLTIVSGSATTTSGSVAEANNAISASVGTLSGTASATIRVKARIAAPLPPSASSVSNQATVSANDVAERKSDDPGTTAVADSTVTAVLPAPYLALDGSFALSTDADGNGVASPGDTVAITSRLTNSGNANATNATAAIASGANLSLVSGSVVASQGNVTSGNASGQTTATANTGTLAPGGTATITHRAVISAATPAAIKSVKTTAAISSTQSSARTVDPSTIIPVVQTSGPPPVLSATKVATLATDSDGDGTVSPGDTLNYKISIANTGAGAANDVAFTDTPGVYTALIAGSVQAGTPATVTTGNGTTDTAVAVSAATIRPGTAIEMNFQVKIDPAFPIGVEAVLNQGSVDSRELRTVTTVDPSGTAAGGITRTPVTPPPLANPIVKITSPTGGSQVTAQTQVTAQISPPVQQRIVSWCVKYRAKGEIAQTELACGDSAPSGALATFDPTTLTNGVYELTVEADSSGGGSNSDTVDIAVDGNLKLGRFTTTYRDMSVPISSLPIQISRTYDSYDKSKGDFGIGWRLGIENFTAQTNGALGEGGWGVQPSGCGSVLGSMICLSNSFKRLSPHFVTVRWPDGHQEVFDFTPSAGADINYDASAAFTGRAGSTSTLEVDGDSYIQYLSDGNIYDGDMSAYYNPQRFKLTAKDGTTYVIDADGGLKSATDRLGNSITVDRNGVHSSTGKSIEFERDASGRVSAINGPSGERVGYSYSLAGDLASATDARGDTMSFTYNSRHDLLATKDPQNRAVRTVAYDSAGRMTSITDGAGHTTAVSTDPAARQQVITAPDARMTTITSFDPRGNLLRAQDIFDAKTRSTSFEYDARDNLTKTTDALGRVRTSTFDSSGNQTSSTDPRGNTTEFTYDVANELTKQSAPNGESTSITRDADELPTRIDRGGGRITDLTYDNAGLLTAVSDPLGRSVSFAHDSAGNTTSQQTPSGTTSATYDASNRLKTRTDAVGATTRFDYDGDGNLTKVTDANGGAQSYQYDYLGRLTKETDQLGAATNYAYDAAGRVATRADRNGQTETFEYDPAGRLTAKHLPDGNDTAIIYDGAGRPTTLTNSDGKLDFTYDLADQVTNATSSAVPGSNQPTASFEYTYDQSGNRTKITRASEVTSYAYDQLSRLQAVTDPAGGAFGFTRDALGRLQEMTRPNGVKTTYAWDQADQVKDIVHASTAGTLDQAHYAYNNAGLRTQLTDNWGAHNYTYDTAGQLTGADNPGTQPDEVYTYDLLGNRISGGYGGQIHDAANRLTSDNKFLYAYDAEGNLTAKTERALGTVTSYSWDAEHRLRQVTLPSGQVERFRYDPVGRRIEVSGTSGTKRYAYGADQNFQAEFDGSNNLTASYTFGLGLDTPLEMRRGSTASYYQQDALGSVGSLSSSTGAVSQRYQYGAFGEALTASDATGNPFSFTGRELDTSTDAYFHRARWNEASTGRFSSEDPIPSVNATTYASNAPATFADPTGAMADMSELDTSMLTEEELQKWNTAGYKNEIEGATQFYRFYDRTKDMLQYVGRTKDLLRRSAQHGERIAEDTLEELGRWALSRTQARAIEQAFIRNAGGKRVMANEINAMAENATNQELIRIAQILIG